MDAQSAHDYATRAKRALQQGRMAEAVDEHKQATDHYLAAIAQTRDPEAVRTLKLLYTSHTRQARELSRRCVDTVSAVVASSLASATMPVDVPSTSATTSGVTTTSAVRTTATTIVDAPFPSTLLLDADAMAEAGKPHFDPFDPFDRFWQNVEALAEKMAAPVAMTVAPLLVDKSASSSTKGIKNQPGTVQRPRAQTLDELRAGIADSGVVMVAGNSQRQAQSSAGHRTITEGSYMMVSTVSAVADTASSIVAHENALQGHSPRKTMEEYAMENRQLKRTIDLLSKKLQDAQRLARENALLRGSIAQFRRDFRERRGVSVDAGAQQPVQHSEGERARRVEDETQRESK